MSCRLDDPEKKLQIGSGSWKTDMRSPTLFSAIQKYEVKKKYGGNGRNRTYSLLVRSEMLCSVELRLHDSDE